jgi:hypothetical protein
MRSGVVLDNLLERVSAAALNVLNTGVPVCAGVRQGQLLEMGSQNVAASTLVFSKDCSLSQGSPDDTGPLDSNTGQ